VSSFFTLPTKTTIAISKYFMYSNNLHFKNVIRSKMSPLLNGRITIMGEGGGGGLHDSFIVGLHNGHKKKTCNVV
jgi:hypothetical protein